MSTYEIAVTDDEPLAKCAHCGRPFADEDLHTLHLGLEHFNQLNEDEQAAYVDAYESETEALRLFQLQAVIALVVVYFVLLNVYSLVA